MHNARATLVAALLAVTFAVLPLSAQLPDSTGPKDSASTDSSAARPQTLRAVRITGGASKSRYAPSSSRTATKTPQLLRDVPQSVSVVTQALVRDQGMQGMADVARFLPGVTMGQGEGNRDQPTIRGNSSTADFFMDGVRDDVQYIRDLYNLERVEALKGSNAMVFGRGGGGGALNRVTKEAQWATRRDITAEGGEFGKRRVSGDLQQAFSQHVAARFNAMHENSSSYRDGATLQRSGWNPTISFASESQATRVMLAYEHFRDRRTADRGIPSYLGRPIETDPSTFFGDPAGSHAKVVVNSVGATVTRETGKVTVRNHTRLAAYDKFYQNVFAGAVDAAGENVSISAYNNATQRQNLFNQTDLTWSAWTGSVSHAFLAGAEFGRQETDNLRQTGFFGGTATSVLVPVSRPFVSTAVLYRQNPTDADDRTVANTRSLYVQDQVSLSRELQLIGGIRYERFDLRFAGNRSLVQLKRSDDMLSPRIGIVVKPAELVSLYASYSISFLPGSGDQFAALTDVTSALKPERFTNYEAGAKWDAMDRLALSAAFYRLDRTNTRAAHPTDPALAVQTGSQRSQGFELTATGNVSPSWDIAAGLARQSAVITSPTTVGPVGARVPLVPRTSVSIWNKYAVSPRWGLALGAVHQSEMFTAIDNKVSLPAFTRFDGGLYAQLFSGFRAQINVENLLDERYYPTAHSNNNITPGSPRAGRISVTAEF